MEGCVFCMGIEKDRVLFETRKWIARQLYRIRPQRE